MIFKTIPQNGASWQNPLLYTIEFDQPKEQVAVEIYDQISAQTMGVVMLYNVESAEIDIAPYIRSVKAQIDILERRSGVIQSSYDACRIVLNIDGESSEQRLFWRSDISGLSFKFFSEPVPNDTIAQGEVIRLSFFATDTIEIIVNKELAGVTSRYAMRTLGIPSDVAIEVKNVMDGERIEMIVRLNSQQSTVYNYRVVKRDSSAIRLAWINVSGGLEAYTFAQSIKRRVEVKAEDVEAESGWYRRIASARVVRGLIMAGAMQSEVDRVMEMLLSSKVYRCDGFDSMLVHLLTDTIAYDDHGKLRRLEFDIEEEWKGGRYE